MLPLSLSSVKQFLNNLGQFSKSYLDIQPLWTGSLYYHEPEQDKTSKRQGNNNLNYNTV